MPLQVASPQQNCIEWASFFPPRKATAPLTAPFERLASKGPAGTANIQPPLAQPPSSPEGIRITTAVTGLRSTKFQSSSRSARGSGSPLCSAAFSPAYIEVDVVEIGIIQIATMPNDATGWQRWHFDLLTVLDHVAKSLVFD